VEEAKNHLKKATQKGDEFYGKEEALKLLSKL
jgi:hypothetical protein